MFWAAKLLPNNVDAGGFLVLALLLIGMSSSAVMWLRGVASLNSNKAKARVMAQGADHE